MADREPCPALIARELSWQEALPLQRDFDSLDSDAAVSNTLAWSAAAADVLGPDRLVPVALVDADRQVAGLLTLERGAAGWRSGSPGARVLGWPMRTIGYDYRPRWRPECRERVRRDWLHAVRATFGHLRLELARTATEAMPDGLCSTDRQLRARDGEATWVAPAPPTLDEYRFSLPRRYRKDLDYYYRRIARSGGLWIDTCYPSENGLAACVALHRARLATKGKTSAYMTSVGGEFVRALAARSAGTDLRLSTLEIGGRPAASCLSLLHRRRYWALMSGWDAVHAKLDLGRQVLYHQIRCAFEDGLDEINLLGGDLAYKIEFGLQPRRGVDLLSIPSGNAMLRQNLVEGVLRVYRDSRGLLRQARKLQSSP